MIDEAMTARARKIAEARYGFLWHLPLYLIINLGMVGAWLVSGQGFFWPIFPIFFWGIGLVSHYMAAYRGPSLGWIDRETQRILAEEQRRRQS